MSTIDRSLITRGAYVVCLTLMLSLPVAAQQPANPQSPPPVADSSGFLTRYDFHLSAAALRIDDERFSWDTHFGGDLDVVDYRVGRTTLAMDYEAMLGNQLRPFDPNQGNYTLEAATSVRAGESEFSFLLHHVSRHLGDREKTEAIAWNVVGGRVFRHLEAGDTAVDASADLGWMVQHSNVDYRWEANGGIFGTQRVGPRVSAYFRGSGRMVGVDSSVHQRDTQVGGVAEAGVRLKGNDGVVELFVGVERRIDADPLDFQPQHWALAGFRLARR